MAAKVLEVKIEVIGGLVEQHDLGGDTDERSVGVRRRMTHLPTIGHVMEDQPAKRAVLHAIQC